MGLTRITSDGITDATIATADLADQSVTLAKLPHGTSSNDGKFLRANNGADPTFETVSSVGGSTGVDFNDNVKARFGTGNDLEIFHDSNDSIINDGGTGDLKFQVGGSTKFQSYSVSGETGGLKLDGTVLKFEGISQSSDQPNLNTGNPSMMWVFDEELNIAGYGKISFTEQGFKRWTINNGALHPHGTTYNNLGNSSNRVGNAYIQTSVDLIDNAKLLLGSSDDLQIYHDGSKSIIADTGTGHLEINTNNLRVQNAAANETILYATENGSVQLYYDNSKKFETMADGVILQDLANNTVQVKLNTAQGTGGSLYANTASSQFGLLSTSGDWLIKTFNNGSVELYHDNTKMFSTESRGAIIQKSGSANLIIGSTNAGGANLFLDGASNGDGGGGDYCGIRGTSSGHLTLFADNPSTNGVIYFQTGNASDRWAMNADGHFLPNNNNAYDIGSSSLRVRNIYTNDLNLSNEGGANDVDGTWGSYTIQEGAEDLFLVNRRNGKKYKFNLTEVS